jgi:hypothetical protein
MSNFFSFLFNFFRYPFCLSDFISLASFASFAFFPIRPAADAFIFPSRRNPAHPRTSFGREAKNWEKIGNNCANTEHDYSSLLALSLPPVSEDRQGGGDQGCDFLDLKKVKNESARVKVIF